MLGQLKRKNILKRFYDMEDKSDRFQYLFIVSFAPHPNKFRSFVVF